MPNGDKPWFKSWPPNMPKHIEYPIIPLFEILRTTSQKYPKREALTFLEKTLTYSELDALSDQFAASLLEIGVKANDRVALFLPNSPQFVIAYFGVLKAGAIVTALNPFYKEREIEQQLKNSETETIIALNSLFPPVDAIWSRTFLKRAILTDLNDFAKKIPQECSTLKVKPRLYSFSKLLKDDKSKIPPKPIINPEENTAVLQYTGGTTGVAKGAMLTHFNLVSNTIMFATWIEGKQEKETFLTALPLFHIYGMTTSMNVPIFLGAKMVITPRFNPPSILETIQTQKVTVFCGVPTMYASLLAEPEIGRFDLTSVRVCISGASSLNSNVQEKFMQLSGGLLVEGYGLTEASPVTHCTPVNATTKTIRIGSIGLPLPDTDCKFVDARTGNAQLEIGETGEMVVKGPQIMKGYWKNPEETALVLREGWLFTGDIGKMDENGYVYITDRKKDLIKYKDYSVYPHELENILCEHPKVKLCAVIGKPDPVAGEIPKAYVVLKEGAQVSEKDLMEFVNDKVAPYKAIREMELRKNLPMSTVGKVLKRILKEGQET
jgi:long-chain acyl-CoA synthetase